MSIDLGITAMGQPGPAFAAVVDQDDRLSIWAGVDFPLGIYGE